MCSFIFALKTFAGVGCFVFAPLTNHLLKHYDWDGTILVFAAICLNFCVCGSLMRPLELVVKGPSAPEEIAEPRRNSTNSIFIKDDCGPSFFIHEQQLLEEEEDEGGVELVIPSFSEPQTAVVKPAVRKSRSRVMSACEPALTNSKSQFLNSMLSTTPQNQLNSIKSTPQFAMLTRVQSTAGAQLRRKESVAYGAQLGSELFLQPSAGSRPHRRESGGGTVPLQTM